MNTISNLILKYINNEITNDEQLQLDAWIIENEENRKMFIELCDPVYRSLLLKHLKTFDENEAWNRIQSAQVATAKEKRTFFKNRSMAVRWLTNAAVISGIIISTVAILQHYNRVGQKAYEKDLSINAPVQKVSGSNNAILTLANGEEIEIETASNGVLANLGATKIVKLSDSVVSYVANVGVEPISISWNKISIPSGSVFQVELPDGSRVWLNNMSSLRFPVSFLPAAKREVELEGEGYFEVAKSTKPFMVKTKQMNIHVLGTHFNVMAYPNEGVTKTTLVTGAVKVASNATGKEVILKTGQQALVTPGSDLLKVSNGNIMEAVAWKSGEFGFDGMNIESILRQMERWYNVEIVYKDDIGGGSFTGSFSRRKDIGELLDILKEGGQIRYELAGRKVYIYAPK